MNGLEATNRVLILPFPHMYRSYWVYHFDSSFGLFFFFLGINERKSNIDVYQVIL